MSVTRDIARHLSRSARSRLLWPHVLAFAVTAAIGCLAFGIGIAMGAGAAVTLGMMITATLPRRATA